MDDYKRLMNLISSRSPSDDRDLRIWRWEGKGQFTVKSYRSFLSNRGATFPVKSSWNIKAPLYIYIAAN